MEISLTGQTAIVTGGDSGLGRATAILFGEAGANVIINYNRNAEKAADVVDAILKSGGKAIAVQADTSKEAAVARLFQSAVDSYGGVDILIANAGMQKDATVGAMTLEQWQTVIDVNLTGQFLCARAAIRRFREQGSRGHTRAIGRIVCMSSVHEIIPWAGHVNYAASKGGIGMMMRTLAQEVAPERIRVNSIAPGAIRTPINEAATEGEAGRRLLKLIPYKRIGDPVDVARVALFLVSDMADYIVGATLYVDGGMTLFPGFEDNS